MSIWQIIASAILATCFFAGMPVGCRRPWLCRGIYAASWLIVIAAILVAAKVISP